MKLHIHRLEKYWLAFGIIMLGVFLVLIGISAFGMGNQTPESGQYIIIDPEKVHETAPFDNPGLEQIGENEYNAYLIAYAFGFTPGNLEIPLGATVHFYITSPDVVHGLQVPGTNINMMVLPGEVNHYTHTFTEAKEYLVLCNEYCGADHEYMATTFIVK